MSGTDRSLHPSLLKRTFAFAVLLAASSAAWAAVVAGCEPGPAEPGPVVPQPTVTAPPTAPPPVADAAPPDAGLKLGLFEEPVGSGQWIYWYLLPANSWLLYPDKKWLPPPYTLSYPNLGITIANYTNQSLGRSALPTTSALVTVLENGQPYVILKGVNPTTLTNFALAHQAFMDGNHAAQALNGVNACKAASGCWNPAQPDGGNPWAFFLPLGLPLLNQQAVLFLDYPPDDSLSYADYLKNFTMDRWYAVLQSAGIQNPFLYETIVDAHPIAAPGSGQSQYMPDATKYFNSGTNAYITPMVSLLANPPSNTNPSSLPVMILGSPAQKTWAAIVGAPVGTLSVGQTTLPGSTKPTSWVASLHPDVTTYQCCKDDKSPGCYDSESKSYSWSLIKDEQTDLTAACIVQTMVNSPGIAPATAKSQCEATWVTNPAAAQKHTTCVRAKLDYDFTTPGACKCQAAAEAFCNTSTPKDSACPSTTVFTCPQNNLCPPKAAADAGAGAGAAPKAVRKGPRPK